MIVNQNISELAGINLERVSSCKYVEITQHNKKKLDTQYLHSLNSRKYLVGKYYWPLCYG